MLTLTSIANFIIQASIVAPDRSSQSPIHTVKLLSATFVRIVYHTLLYRRWNFCMQLHITCSSFPLKLCILFQHGAYLGGRNCCPIVSDGHCTCNATFKWTTNNAKFGFNEEMYIGLTILYLAKRPLVEITGKLTFRNSRAVIG